MLTLLALACLATQVSEAPFRIDCVDTETGRGVPLVQLRTTSQHVYISDSNGVVAFDEPDLMGREVWFHVLSHGYELAPDHFGYRGVRLNPRPGERATVHLARVNVAELQP